MRRGEALVLLLLLEGCQCGDGSELGGGNDGGGDARDSGADGQVNDEGGPDSGWADGGDEGEGDAGSDGGDCPRCDDEIACTRDECPIEQGGACQHVPDDTRCDEHSICDGAKGCVDAQGCERAADCDDGNACDGVEICGRDGYCHEGTPLDCSDDVACTEDSCREGQCQNVPNAASCGEGMRCDLGRGCVEAPPCERDRDCDDGFFCNGVELCSAAGRCRPGDPPACADDVDCTMDDCGELSDRCIHDPQDLACDDGLLCDGPERCDVSVGCTLGEPPSCGDARDCTTDWCDADQNVCRHAPLDADGDGQGPILCGGMDCNDGIPTIHSGAAEACNGIDDTCDGRIDEGVLSECGDCRDCHVEGNGGEDGWTFDGQYRTTVDQEAGAVVLDRSSDESGFAWIANSSEGTVSKLDLQTGAEVGRFRCGIGGVVDNLGSEGGSPSRSAVDGNGDSYIASRAFGIQGSVTKIAAHEADCVDRNLNGQIDTSRTNVAIGYQAVGFASADECVLWTHPVGPVNGLPRALAIDAGDHDRPSGYPWVGLHDAQQIVKLNPDSGTAIATVDVDVHPYGMAIAGDGRIWIANSWFTGNGIQAYDTHTEELSDVIPLSVAAGCQGQYGIAVDGAGRVWLGGFPCARAFRYDPATSAWDAFDAPEEHSMVRGIAVDGAGRVWMAAHLSWRDGFLFGIDAETLDIIANVDIAGEIPIGVGVDDSGRIWTSNQQSNTASRYDPTTGIEDTFAVGAGPYTYSDFTGFARRTFTASSGTFSRFFTANCAGRVAHWELVSWDVDRPLGTAVELRVRGAADEGSLGDVAFTGPWQNSPAHLDLAPGPVQDSSVLEVQMSLMSNTPRLSPTVRSTAIQYVCQ